jgi:hypothetical protein
VARSPIALRAQPLAAPAAVGGTGVGGSLDFDVRFDFAGSYTASISGLEAAQITTGIVRDNGGMYEFRQPGQSLPSSVRRIPLTVPAGTRLLRVAMFGADVVPDGAELDLYLYSCPGFSSCDPEALLSTNPDSNETVDLLDPPPGDYYVDVHGFDTQGADATFAVSVWTLGGDFGNALLGAPSTVSPGQTATVSLSWSGLDAGRNLGLIDHRADGVVVGLTVVQIDN